MLDLLPISHHRGRGGSRGGEHSGLDIGFESKGTAVLIALDLVALNPADSVVTVELDVWATGAGARTGAYRDPSIPIVIPQALTARRMNSIATLEWFRMVEVPGGKLGKVAKIVPVSLGRFGDAIVRSSAE